MLDACLFLLCEAAPSVCSLLLKLQLSVLDTVGVHYERAD